MKGEMEKSGRFLVIAIFFLFFISTAQGAWDNDDLMYANVLGTTEIRLPVHNIDTVEDFENIQAAIDDPDTKDGHTISVDAGIYRERVVINKQLKLRGENKDTTIIDGYGSGNCIQVTADNVEISGFTIKNGNYGVYLESSNCRVIDNNITSIDFDGISLRRNSVNNTIAHNSLSEVKGKGIRLSSSCNNRIHDNDLSENGKGISLSSSHNNIFYHNRLTNNSNCGISLSSSNNNIIQDNDLSGSEEGIFLRGCNKNYIYHNNFIENRIQASDSSDTNRWDKGPIDGGNYWSDHKCTGNPSDGNQPYNISGGIMGATDFYPFMDRDGWLTPPSSPTLTDPGTNDTDGNYIVRWSKVSSATNYTLEEDTNSSFSSPTIVYSGSGTSKEITGKSDGRYYYQVKACNAWGCSDWSNKENITITIDTILPTVTISYPTSGQTLTSSNITVNGTASDNVAVSKVEVKVGLGGWQTALGTTSWSTPVTLAVGSNTINASVTDTSGNINQTSVMVICDMLANLTVTILYPNGGESIPVGTQVPVSVHATDDTAVTNVTFFYSSNGGSTWDLIGAGKRVSGTDKDGIWHGTWNTNGLSVGSNYLIKAVASDGTLTIDDLSESTFSLCTLPSPPTLADPGTNDTDGNYTVSWSTVSSATNYTLEEDTSSSFSSPTKIYSGSGTSKEITGKSEATYYYQVKACNECGCSKWSNIVDINIGYITKDTMLPNVTITYPTKRQTFTTTTITVKGTSSDNVEVSKVEVKVGLGGWQTASGTTSWSTPVTLENGYNTIYARATDTSDNTNQTLVTVFVIGKSSVTISAVPSAINLSESVNISGIISSVHSANVTLTFTTPNNATQKNSTTSMPNGRYYFVFQPEEVGKWTVNATWAGDSDIAGNTSNTVSFTVNADKVGYAIIIAGSKDGNVSDAIDRSAKNTYSVLLNNCSFTPERIFYLNSSRRQDVNGDDKAYVDKKISPRANITYAINTWANDSVSANAPLLIYIVGHIENDTFFVNGTNNLTASYLNKSLNNLTNESKCDNITVVCEAGNSGSFIDDLSYNPSYNLSSQRGRIIITSTDENNVSLFCGERGGEFSYCFFDNISSGLSIKAAFETASNSTKIEDNNELIKDYNKHHEEQRFLPQRPWLDDNGDGNGSASPLNGIKGDGLLAASRHIGTQANGHSSNNGIPAIRLEGV